MNDVISEEELRQLIEGGTANQTLQRQYEVQRKRAEAMRGMTPQGQMVGGRLVTPHFMQYVGEMAKNISGHRLGQMADATGGRLDANMGAQNATILRALLRNRNMNQPAQPVTPPQTQVRPAGMPAPIPAVPKQQNPYDDAGY
jgi:hypothetical protein